MRKKLCRCLTAVLLVIVCISSHVSTAQASETYDGVTMLTQTYEAGLDSIMGTSTTTVSQLINYYQSHASYPSFYASSDAPNIYTFCRIYMEECDAEGVRAEVAFAQAMKETGFLRFGGDVNISQYNFAGIGATGGVPGNSFPSVRIGVRAQVQHLKAYASTESLHNPVVDPRFSYVRRGSAPYVQWLGIHENPSGAGWATAWGYGYSIVNDYMGKLGAMSSFSTWYQGVDYSAVYNPDYYLQHNPDVAAACGQNSDTLILHFLRCGMNEGRCASAEFDVKTYKKRYKDLRAAYGQNYKAYYQHYRMYGKKEGRSAIGTVSYIDGITVYQGVDYSAVYDYNYYVNHNADVKRTFGEDDIATLEHFVKFGMAEGRRAKETFDVVSYYNAYRDLRVAFGQNYKAYYIHYMNYGQKEGRTATGVTALRNPTTTFAGKDYSAVYNYDYYINHNADVKKAFGNDDAAVLAHFVNYGMAEGRCGSDAFCVTSYAAKYADLRNAFGNNWKQYYEHYLNYGIKEGRTDKQ